MTINTETRCLAHGCQRADECLRHLVIRNQAPPADDNVVPNACATELNFIQISKEK